MKMTEANYDREHDRIIEEPKTETEQNKEEDVFYNDLLAMSEMSTKEKYSYKWSQLKKRLATMEPAERRKYVIYYYRYYFVILFVALILIGFGIRKLYVSSLPVDLMVVISNDYNIDKEPPLSQYIEDWYRSYYETPSNHRFEVVENIRLEPSGEYNQDTYISSVQFWSYIKDDEVDVLIGDDTALNFMLEDNSLIPIDEILDAELYEKVKDRVVMKQDDTKKIRNGESFPAAIEIRDTEFVKGLDLSYEKAYIMIPSNRADDPEATIRFIKMVFDISE